jgi:hypothetical protein
VSNRDKKGIVIVSEGPPSRSVVEILRDPPKLKMEGSQDHSLDTMETVALIVSDAARRTNEHGLQTAMVAASNALEVTFPGYHFCLAKDDPDGIRLLVKQLRPVPPSPLRKGDKVRMTVEFKTRMRVSSVGHIIEFGNCVGIVQGFIDYHNDGDMLDHGKIGPEVDVRWQPSNLRYAYMPEELEIVE